VLVIGAGIAGATAAYALASSGVRNVCIIDSGSSGVGYSNRAKPQGEFLNTFPVFPENLYSGTMVMPFPTSTIKMMVNIYPASSADFITHHGVEGAKRYLRLAREGLAIQKELAQMALPDPAEQLTCKGSVYLARECEVEEFKEEYTALCSLGCEGIELWDAATIADKLPSAPEGFVLGIYFPQDAVINSSEYAKGLVRMSVATECVSYFENVPRVVDVDSNEDHAIATLANGAKICAKYLVVCTGGFFTGGKELGGILRPCFSYLVSIPEPQTDSNASSADMLGYTHSPNMFSWGFTHDWCLTKGHFRCSGQDHFSALKAPRYEERCEKLARWTCERHPYLLSKQPFEELSYSKLFGVYSETPDSAPLVGRPNDASRICYVLGCNAWGQASMSYAGMLVPGLLGYTELSEEQRDALRLLTIRRCN
jgi:glycine/D-amino acid oxidase-like deaminating enzyme